MGELTVNNSKRAPLKVDLTAMVDLAFLLISFLCLPPPCNNKSQWN